MTSFLLLPPWDFLSLPIVVPLLSYAVKARRWIKIKKKLRKESNSLKHSPAHGSALFINADILFCLFFFLTWSQTSKEKKRGVLQILKQKLFETTTRFFHQWFRMRTFKICVKCLRFVMSTNLFIFSKLPRDNATLGWRQREIGDYKDACL
jgi:hypothetical protein